MTTVVYSITHGGYEMGLIHPTRGLRQRDPLSPYLFIICAEGLSGLLRNCEIQKSIHGIKICRGAPTITHMFFADDSYLFCKADPSETLKMKRLLETYDKASGQQVNRNKSSIFYSSNVMDYNKHPISHILQMGEANAHSTYLGLSNVIGRNKSAMLGYLKNKVNTRICSWNAKHVSRAGKEILVKQVAQTLPSYAMSVFLLPLDITRNIEKSLSKFWWNSAQNQNPKLSKHKHAGGMGFRNFRDFNIAMLGKQVWRLLSNPNSLVARLYKAKYFPNSDLLQANLGHNPSFIWRSLLEATQLLKGGICWRVGDGASIKILDQPWLLSKENPYITSDPDPLQNRMVSSLFCMNSKAWDLEVLTDVLNERDRACVMNIPVSESLYVDTLFWLFEDSGIYLVKSAYKLLQSQKGDWNAGADDIVWQKLWRIKAPPKALNLVWRVLSGCLPILTQL